MCVQDDRLAINHPSPPKLTCHSVGLSKLGNDSDGSAQEGGRTRANISSLSSSEIKTGLSKNAFYLPFSTL